MHKPMNIVVNNTEILGPRIRNRGIGDKNQREIKSVQNRQYNYSTTIDTAQQWFNLSFLMVGILIQVHLVWQTLPELKKPKIDAVS